ncbi:hypothetical protein [Moraxella lacunata]|uniref:hypothetical protein n=1 Tax=Moraxella lacunata TaxID=477 RepID=UPI003EDEED7D
MGILHVLQDKQLLSLHDRIIIIIKLGKVRQRQQAKQFINGVCGKKIHDIPFLLSS